MITLMVTRRRVIVLAAVFLALAVLWLSSGSQRFHSFVPHSQPPSSFTERLSAAFPYHPENALPKRIWQTWKVSRSQADFEYEDPAMSWSNLNPDFEHKVLTDDTAVELVESLYGHFPEVREAFTSLPKPVLKADFFRYLILLAQGGVYSDIDTTALRPVSSWISETMQPYGLVVGIEADPNRPDWQQWYARRIQFCQWTIMSKIGHPVLVQTVASITEESLRLKALGELTRESMGAVVEFTGPGRWTDSLFDFFNRFTPSESNATESDGISWKDFVNLRQPTKQDDVVILPITSFSPGVGHMGAGSTQDPLAFVKHGFSGTWKHDERK